MRMFLAQLMFLAITSTPSQAGEKSDQNQQGFQAARQYTGEVLGDKQSFAGTVVETLNSGGYTYVQFKQGKSSMWLATSKTTVNKGDFVSFADSQAMHNFHSKTLNRTFEQIYFVANLSVKRM